jgi:hypothetical protein
LFNRRDFLTVVSTPLLLGGGIIKSHIRGDLQRRCFGHSTFEIRKKTESHLVIQKPVPDIPVNSIGRWALVFAMKLDP